MKNLLFLLTVALSLTLFSCGKDDPQDDPLDPVTEDPVVEIPLIVGDWNLTGISYAGTETVSSAGVPDAVTTLIGQGRDIDHVLSFNLDSTYVSEGSFVMDVTSTINGFSQTFEEPATDFLGTGVYEFTDPDIIITTIEPRVVETTMTELSEDSLSYTALISMSSTEFGVLKVKNLNYNFKFAK